MARSRACSRRSDRLSEGPPLRQAGVAGRRMTLAFRRISMFKRLRLMQDALVLLFAGAGLPKLERTEGQTIVEYALILALIAVAAFAAIFFLRDSISSLFSTIGSKL